MLYCLFIIGKERKKKRERGGLKEKKTGVGREGGRKRGRDERRKFVKYPSIEAWIDNCVICLQWSS